MRLRRRPCQHGAGDAEIVVPSGRALVCNAALMNLGLEVQCSFGKLFVELSSPLETIVIGDYF
jgi:hypothetical protein